MNPTTSPITADRATKAAMGLLAALLEEAQQWACDDAEDSAVLERLDNAGPAEQLDILAEATLAPSHLVAAVTEAVHELAPQLLV